MSPAAVTTSITRRAAVAALCAGFFAKAWGQYRMAPWTGPSPVSWLEGVDQHGKSWSLQALKGQVVILNFWATWCPPCIEEMPSLQWLSDQSGSNQVVLAVNVKESSQRAQRFMQSMDLTLPCLSDRRGEWSKRLGITTLPTTLLISADARTIVGVQGEVNWAGSEALSWLARLKSSAAGHT